MNDSSYVRRSCATSTERKDDVGDRQFLEVRNCARDGGRPSGTALQGEVSNHRKLRRLSAGVVSVAGKGMP